MENIEIQEETLYKESYRNQYHFSPKVGWMNDINGLWYKNGIYHLTYQADEGHLSPVSIGWGHAVSDDMIHWKQLSMALEPGVNTKGSAFSGSVVFDSNNTAGYGKDTVILIYTDTVLGQCMNYLDEKTNKFIPYDKNPIVSMDEAGIKAGLEPAAQRDPKVFWDDNSQSWIMIVFRERDEKYGEYLQVYSSLDLKTWHRLDDFVQDDFHECPNIFPLMLDGKEQKWVLQAASGRYCIGHFDGKHLIVEQDKKQGLLKGRDAYAGQTFVGLPNGRIVYMCWLDNWGGTTVETSPWRNSASLPYELSLHTLPDGTYHIFAEPIKEISNLYNQIQSKICETVLPEKNIFDECKGKEFLAKILVDMANSIAKEMKINIRGKQLIVDLIKHELHSEISVTDPGSWTNGDCCVPFEFENQCFDLQIFADDDCIEIIFGKGKMVYFEEYGFDPLRKDFSITFDSPVKIEKAEYYTIKSIWNEK